MPMKVSLIPLAEQIDEARIAANANEATAPQTGVYGHLSIALQAILKLMTGDVYRAEQMYQLILDGATVREARRDTEPARPMREPEVPPKGDREYRQAQHELDWTPERYGGRK